MGPFRFRLATLLRIREAERDERRAQLADAERALEIVGARIAELDGELLAIGSDNRRSVSGGRIDVDRLLDRQRYEYQLIAERAATLEQYRKIEVEVERRREVAIAADREVKILEKLRENQAAKHRAEEARVELKQFDETAGRSYFAREEV